MCEHVVQRRVRCEYVAYQRVMCCEYVVCQRMMCCEYAQLPTIKSYEAMCENIYAVHNN